MLSLINLTFACYSNATATIKSNDQNSNISVQISNECNDTTGDINVTLNASGLIFNQNITPGENQTITVNFNCSDLLVNNSECENILNNNSSNTTWEMNITDENNNTQRIQVKAVRNNWVLPTVLTCVAVIIIAAVAFVIVYRNKKAKKQPQKHIVDNIIYTQSDKFVVII
ncbi:Hypothetical_protein [Hexamita inflata]|uniref:Hypothetical_protein n=1 Tax=Hexamita inflata TaxID=28002 RepID=A0ABP1I0P8_9EUKA